MGQESQGHTEVQEPDCPSVSGMRPKAQRVPQVQAVPRVSEANGESGNDSGREEGQLVGRKASRLAK
jgi:hypothetical protein